MAITSCSRIHLIHNRKYQKEKISMAFELRIVWQKKMWNMPISNTYCERETSITWPIIDRFPFILFYLDFWQQRHPFHQYKKTLLRFSEYTQSIYTIY